MRRRRRCLLRVCTHARTPQVSLDFSLREDVTAVRADVTYKAREAAAAAPLQLHGHAWLDLVSVSLDGKPLGEGAYERTPDSGLRVASVPHAEAFTLHTVVRLKPQENTALEGLYKSSGNFCTQARRRAARAAREAAPHTHTHTHTRLPHAVRGGVVPHDHLLP